MTVHKRLRIGAAAVAVLAGGLSVAAAAPGSAASATEIAHVKMAPSSDQLAACMPGAKVKMTLRQTTDATGKDVLRVSASNLPPKTAFTIFLLEQAGAPFGAAEYIGDLFTDVRGNGSNELRLIVVEGFTSTLVDGVRTRVDLNQIGMWFAEPEGDDFCLGADSPVTPFDGDNSAGVQAFNSRNAEPLPLP